MALRSDCQDELGAARTLEATPETDAALRHRELNRGRLARQEGKTIDQNPWNGGPVYGWWRDGWEYADSIAKMSARDGGSAI